MTKNPSNNRPNYRIPKIKRSKINVASNLNAIPFDAIWYAAF